MNMNPAILMKLMKAKEDFTKHHPKFSAFFTAMFLSGNGIPEGTVVEITVTKPGEEPVSTNMRVQQSDLELAAELKNLMGQ